MKKLKKGYKELLINGALCLILVIVFAVSFFPSRVKPLSGSGQIEPIYNGNRSNNNVTLMFNVYENTENVNAILDVLKKYGAKTTFFVGGCWADDNKDTLIRIIEEGHELGNHGYFHKDHAKISKEKNREEILNTDKIVEGLTGYKMKLFAPPSGSFDDTTLVLADELGYKTIMWSKDTIDWRDRTKNSVYNRAIDVTKGDLVLMHPYAHTLSALDGILKNYQERGIHVVTVTENIKE